MERVSANNIGSHQIHVNACCEMLRRCCETIMIYGAFSKVSFPDDMNENFRQGMMRGHCNTKMSILESQFFIR